MIATIATVCLTASTANINHESRAPMFAPGMGMGLRVPGAEPTSLPSGMNYGIPTHLPRRQLYNNNDDAAAAAAAAMAGEAFISEAAEPSQLPSAIKFGMPASLTGMEGEGEGMGSGDRKLAVQNTLGGKCDLVTNCGTANGKVLSCTVQLFGVGKCVVYQGRTWNEQ
jgi:hypothetical protein